LVVRGKKPFRVVEIKCDGNGFEFKSPGEKEALMHFIPLTFTAGDAAGTVERTIQIETDLGSGAATTCLATATVRAATDTETR
jgi:hypothetical protein